MNVPDYSSEAHRDRNERERRPSLAFSESSMTELMFTRRKALGMAALGGAALLGVPGCGSEDSTTSGAGGSGSFEGETLNIFSWSSIYHKPAWIAEYEKDRGVTVNASAIAGVPEAFAKVKSNPGAYDLVITTSGWLENFADAGLIVPIDEDAVPNMKIINDELPWRTATEYNGENYGVLYSWGNIPLAWVTDEVSPAPDTWRALYEPEYAGKVSLVDDATTVMPFVPIMLGFENPYDLDEAQFAEMREALLDLRGQVTHLSASVEDQTADFASGQTVIGALYDISTQVALREDGITLEQVAPNEGAAIWSDNYSITEAGAEKADLVYDFINYTLTIPWMARMSAATNQPGVLTIEDARSKEAVNAGLTPEVLAATTLPLTEDPDFYERLLFLQRVPNLEDWLDLWNEFKSGL